MCWALLGVFVCSVPVCLCLPCRVSFLLFFARAQRRALGVVVVSVSVGQGRLSIGPWLPYMVRLGPIVCCVVVVGCCCCRHCVGSFTGPLGRGPTCTCISGLGWLGMYLRVSWG